MGASGLKLQRDQRDESLAGEMPSLAGDSTAAVWNTPQMAYVISVTLAPSIIVKMHKNIHKIIDEAVKISQTFFAGTECRSRS